MMVDDNDVAFKSAAPHLCNETFLPCRTFLAGAGIGARVELVPECAGFGQICEFGTVAGLRGLLPGSDHAVLLNLIKAVQNWLIGKIVELPSAQIIVAAFHVADAEPAVAVREERLFEKGDVLVEKLFLQVLGAGGDDHALAGADRGHEIRESLP